jgi:hypothetical protein
VPRAAAASYRACEHVSPYTYRTSDPIEPARAISLTEAAALDGATALVAVSASLTSVAVSYSGLCLGVTGQNTAVGTQAVLWAATAAQTSNCMGMSSMDIRGDDQ